MRMRIDQSADAIYLNLTDRPIEGSEEVADGIIVDYDAEGRIVVADPIDRFTAGAVPAIPYLIGSNGGELSQESFAPLIIQAI